MRSMRCVYLASGLGLIFIAGLTPTASAQSATDGGIRGALLDAPEFIEMLTHVTPEMLRLQQELVETLSKELDYMRQQVTMGAAQLENASNIEIEKTYYRELETLRIMQARLHKKSISGKEILKIRIEVRSKALEILRKHSESAKSSFAAGTTGPIDVAAAKAEVLKAEIMLEALKRAAR